MTEEDKPLEARDSKLLETDEDLREALRTFAAELLEKGGDAETSPRSLYELMCRIRRVNSPNRLKRGGRPMLYAISCVWRKIKIDFRESVRSVWVAA